MMVGLWYKSGSIPEAIAQSRRSGKLFVVYISGTDEASHQMDEYWNDELVQRICKSSCIVIKVDADSEQCKQFSAIYPVLCVPSVYFIDNSGKLVEGIASQAAADDFVSKIVEVTKPYLPAVSGASAGTSQIHTRQTEILDIQNSSNLKNDSVSEKKEDRLEKKMKKHKEKEEKDDSNQELQHREWGRNLQKLKEAQREAQMKRDIEERKASKLEEKAAKERVKKQIEQDKLDRAAKYQQEKAEKAEALAKRQAERIEKVKSEKILKESEENLHARVQFRIPDGSTLVHRFEATDTLHSAFDFVASQNIPELSSVTSFSLSLAYPRRVLSDADHSLTYSELGMIPSASVVVLPGSNRKVASAVSSDGILSVLVFILMIPVRLLTYIWNFFAGSSSNQMLSSQTSLERASLPQRHDESSVRMRRQGNMTRFKDGERDDDDNATWNGNSTQQM